MMMKNRIPFTLLLLAAATACDRPAFLQQTQEAEARQPVHVDSVFPIEEEVRRFRATLTEAPEALGHAFATPDELVAAYVAALEAADVEALSSMALTRAEFAYLYYPHTRYTERPYELSPAVVWFQMGNHGGRGLSRALQRHGGEPLGFTGYRCPDEPQVEGPNRIATGCVIDRVRQDGRPEALPLLGPIVERDGVFKLLSHANGL
jgi:hypothetical protein